MNVRTAMLESPVTTTPEETFPELLNRLLGSRQATAAVLDPEGRLVGLVGIHDVLRKIVPHYVDIDFKLMEVMHENYLVERMAGLKDTRVADFMTRKLDTVAPDDTLIKAAGIIVERCRKTLPVIEDGKFLGMVTRRSILETVGPTLL
ncbi:MAG: CBS domain-containing protein [Deltaproteobacteria bacterium]|nr:CBS domain-containing protein [Deltaproteobacteria bacterium]